MTEDLTLERAVARFVVNFRYEDIDAATLEALKGLIKDQFAIQIGASVLPWSRQTLAFRKPRPGKATIVNAAATQEHLTDVLPPVLLQQLQGGRGSV